MIEYKGIVIAYFFGNAQVCRLFFTKTIESFADERYNGRCTHLFSELLPIMNILYKVYCINVIRKSIICFKSSSHASQSPSFVIMGAFKVCSKLLLSTFTC